MSPNQLLLQIRSVLRAATWTTSPAEEVFGTSVYITGGIEDNARLPGRIPFAFLNLGDARADGDDPTFVEQDVILIAATSVKGDRFGEQALTGGPSATTPRSSSSKGRGILEIETALMASVARLTGADGARILVAHQSATQTQLTEGKHIAWRQYVLRATCTMTDEYPAPSSLVATGGSGEVVLTWDLPASRYDLDSIVLRRASGATPPATPTAGTGVTLGSDLATGVTDSGLAADDYSYALFARYEPYNANDPFHSAQETGTTRASVTVT